jgi:acetyltransferase-like isoleucine patch superfamily enzyme
MTLWAKLWTHFWMQGASPNPPGRLAMRLASWFAPPHKARVCLAQMTSFGYVAWSATIYHRDVRFGKGIFIDDRVVLFQRERGGPVQFGRDVRIYRDAILETGHGGALTVGDGSSIHPRCQINAYVSDIRIGQHVMIAPNCALYSYDHGIATGTPIERQPLTSRGPIVIGDGAWLGFGAIVLSGVRIGEGAVIGAGAVVTRDVPVEGVAIGSPARVIGTRSAISSERLPVEVMPDLQSRERRPSP